MTRIRGTTPAIDTAARGMRVAQTPSEAVLWAALRGRRVAGLKFRRQHALGRFILDFCCVSHRLVVEVDGGVHADRADYDEARTEALACHGYRVLRFSNEQVLTDLPSVIAVIRDAALPHED